MIGEVRSSSRGDEEGDEDEDGGEGLVAVEMVVGCCCCSCSVSEDIFRWEGGRGLMHHRFILVIKVKSFRRIECK